MALLFAAVLSAASICTVADDGPHEGHRDQHDNHHDEHQDEAPHVNIAPDMAEAAGIAVRPAAAGTIERRVRVFGELVAAPEKRSEVRARFPGLVTAVNVDLGQRVERGQALATVESNQSLQDYVLRAPIDGVVQHRHANPGEVAGDEPLFVILDSTALWAELKIFPGRRGEVAAGQPVRIESGDRAAEVIVEHLLPAGGDPFARARLQVDNAAGSWLPGDRVVASILVERVEVPLVVGKQALQQLDGHDVVFVRSGGERYEPRSVELGRQDDRHVEVLSGLSVGESYVADNSYLIKADLEKSGAGHQH